MRPDLADEYSVPNEVDATEELKSNADVSSSVPTTPELESETDEDQSSKFGSSDSMNYDCNTEEFEPDERADEKNLPQIKVEDLQTSAVKASMVHQMHLNESYRSRSKSPRNSFRMMSNFHSSFLKFGLWPEMSYEK